MGVPLKGGPHTQPKLRGLPLVKAGQMLRTVKQCIDCGFDGQGLYAEIENATLDRGYNSDFIIREAERLSAWCVGELAGSSLIRATMNAFPDAQIGKRTFDPEGAARGFNPR